MNSNKINYDVNKAFCLNEASPRPAKTLEIQAKGWIETISIWFVTKIMYRIVSSKRLLSRLCRISMCFGIHALSGSPFRQANPLLCNMIYSEKTVYIYFYKNLLNCKIKKTQNFRSAFFMLQVSGFWLQKQLFLMFNDKTFSLRNIISAKIKKRKTFVLRFFCNEK